MSPEAKEIPEAVMRAMRADTMGEYDPRRLVLELVNDGTDNEGNPLYVFKEPYVFIIPGSDGKTVAYPESKLFNGGSIPPWLQSFIRPMDYWLRVPFARHDLKCRIQGGLRYFVDFRVYTLNYELKPVSYDRINWELFVDVVVADCGLTWNTMALDPTFWNVTSFLLRIGWRFFRAILVYCAVQFFGRKAWNDIEPGTLPVKI